MAETSDALVRGTTSETAADRHDRLLTLPPSAKFAFEVLEFEPGLSRGEAADRTRLSARTTRFALHALTEAGLVEKAVYLPAARERIYTPKPVVEEV
ncbi:MAG TPA: MarR family transcriptional regulator [Halobacteriales archaeon]|nr:MarR family transcriptional regulator [Halobacteriales archaeon]